VKDLHGFPQCTTHSAIHPYHTHWVPFRSLSHPFTSVARSPPAAHNFACLAACHSCGPVMFFAPGTDSKKTRQALASHCCCLSPPRKAGGSPFSTVAGARSRLRIVPPSGAFLSARMPPTPHCPAGLRGRATLLLAAGAITFCQHTDPIYLPDIF
jgi:hypothetical protein